MGLIYGVVEGALPVILKNAIVALATLRNMVDAIFQIVGLRRQVETRMNNNIYPSASESERNPSFGHISNKFVSQRVTEEIRKSLTLIRFEHLCEACTSNDCAVCLTKFEGQDSILKLPNCSHIFHKACLEKWLLDHQHTTCPLCRSSLLTDEIALFLMEREDAMMAEELAVWISLNHGLGLMSAPWLFRAYYGH
ncbi:hypothetical protein O6H91_19G040700 [Diphasiastrum complanatum]|uniref:Uncharacterized protein n=1 Tax=Diphasiastrum complanatum TaxID=34168 RepID=A0ACC2AV66_DIPCM|nr:hypothetical protein O6H91_19G040700 [Diphasiastrum complanatum]